MKTETQNSLKQPQYTSKAASTSRETPHAGSAAPSSSDGFEAAGRQPVRPDSRETASERRLSGLKRPTPEPPTAPAALSAAPPPHRLSSSDVGQMIRRAFHEHVPPCRILQRLAAVGVSLNSHNIGVFLRSAVQMQVPLDPESLRSLADQVRHSETTWGSKDASYAVLALRTLVPCAEANLLVDALADKVATTTWIFRSEDIGRVCNGLQDLADTPSTRKLVATVAAKINASTAMLDARAIETACFGLRSLGPGVETNQLVAALASKIKSSNAELPARSIRLVFQGLEA